LLNPPKGLGGIDELPAGIAAANRAKTAYLFLMLTFADPVQSAYAWQGP
jgi:hypothetical protein